jgi:peptidoglycan/xylan/chitin deacetylase (PgdA/CDA1 family)
MSKRRLAATTLQRLGLLRALEMVPTKPGILIINHHRVGDAASTRFDRGVFSACAEEFDSQLKYFKKHFNVVGGDELEALVSGKAPLNRMHIAITFDDGYRNDYTTSFQVLKANGCTAAFFLVPEYVGTSTVPWWDEIAYLVRNSPRSQITLSTPVPLTVTLEADREPAIYAVLRHYKREDNRHGDKLLAELREQAGCEVPTTGRRFISWEEAREMKAAGMTIGSHTQTHGILGQMPPESQQWELTESKKNIEANLGAKVHSLAYPVGIRGTFTRDTEELARAAGYKMCFSFYGGINTPDHMQNTNLLRMATSLDNLLFRSETVLLSRFGRLPY